jgi:hypothetical protein
MNRPWTQAEEQILKDRYQTDLGASIAKDLNRTKSAVRAKAYKMDLTEPGIESHIPQARMMKVFELIRMLKSGDSYPIKNLAAKIDSSERTVYRYFKLIEAFGFQLEESFEGKYFIITDQCVCPLCGE